MKRDWNVQEYAFLEILKAGLFGLRPNFPQNVDWYLVFRELRTQNVIGLSGKGLSFALDTKAFVPEGKSLTLPDSWRRRIQNTQTRFHKMLGVQKRLVSLLIGSGIPFVILKGSASASLYPEADLRAMNDIDILIRPQQEEIVDTLLRSNGFLPEDAPEWRRERHTKYRYDDVALEVHHRFYEDGLTLHGEELDQFFFKSFSKPQYTTVYDHTFPSLPPLEMGLSLLDHIRHHVPYGLGFRHFLDWVLFVNVWVDNNFWEKTLKPLTDHFGLTTLAVVLTKAAQLFLALPVADHEWCEEADENACWDLFRYFFAVGDFGQKDEQINRVTNVFTGAGIYGGLLRNTQRIGTYEWPLASRYPALRSFAWVYKASHYINKILKRKHPIRDVNLALHDAHERKKLLRELGVSHGKD